MSEVAFIESSSKKQKCSVENDAQQVVLPSMKGVCD
jgi:hypothetical protein